MAVSNPILPGPPQPLGMPNNLAVAVAELDARIFNIIMDYSLNKFDDSSSRIAEGIPNFLATINEFVAAGDPIRMCLPAFPFKSVNKVEKAFGILPDKAEEIALGRLNTMCSRIEEIYEPGAQLTIISDGLVYNGKLPPRFSSVCQPADRKRSPLHSRQGRLGIRPGYPRHGPQLRIHTH